MKKLVVGFILLIPIFSRATSIIIVAKKDAIYVAADSRSTIFFRNNKGQLDSVYRSICKIGHSSNVYFAMAGHADNVIPNIALQTFRNNVSISNDWNVFLSKAKAFYENRFEILRKNDVAQFRRYKPNDVCGFSVFGFRENEAYITTAYFHISTDENTPVKIDIKQSNSPIVALGYHDHLDKSYKLPKNNKSEIFLAEDGVKYEMNFHKSHIALPIDLLKLTPTGPIWIRKKKKCN
jgi:hypothetical protein